MSRGYSLGDGKRLKKIDGNHSEIVKGLRDLGATVQSLAALGKGAPDLLVGIQSRNLLFEVKNPDMPPSHRRLTEAESAWHEMWRGQVHVIHNLSEAIEVITSV